MFVSCAIDTLKSPETESHRFTTPSNSAAATQEVSVCGAREPAIAAQIVLPRAHLPMWLSSMCTMSSASDSKCSPQPPNWQMLEKKEAAAMPVMVFATLRSSSTARAERRSRALARTRAQTDRQTDSGGSSWSSAARERKRGGPNTSYLLMWHMLHTSPAPKPLCVSLWGILHLKSLQK